MPAVLPIGPRSLWVPRQIKPSGVPRINWSHPLTRGLISYWFDPGVGRPVDLVLKRSAVLDTAAVEPTIRATPFGQGLSYVASNSSLHDPQFFPVQSWAHPTSIAAGFYQIGAGTGTFQGYFGICNAVGSDGPTIYQPTTTTFTLAFGNGSGANNFTFANNTFYVVVGTTTGASSWDWWVNGTKQTSGATTTSNTLTSSGVEFGLTTYNVPAARFVNANVFWGAIWQAQLSQTDAIYLYSNPYCFLTPQEREMPVISAGDVLLAQAWM